MGVDDLDLCYRCIFLAPAVLCERGSFCLFLPPRLLQAEKRSDEGGLGDEVWRSSRRCVCTHTHCYFHTYLSDLNGTNTSCSASCRSDVGRHNQGHDLCHGQIWAAVDGPHQSCESSSHLCWCHAGSVRIELTSCRCVCASLIVVVCNVLKNALLI